MFFDNAGTGTVTKRYFAQGEQRIVGGVTTNYFYTRDHLGSIREMMDNNGTTIDARYSYDPFGRSTQVSGSIVCDFQYAGMYEHATSGLSLTQFRAYDPNVGRWISRDPSGEGSGLNLYAYCEGNPINYKDSMGLWIGWDDLVFSAGGALAGDAAQAVSNYITGKSGGYGAAAAGGAAGGLTLLYTANPVAAAAAAVLIQDGINRSSPQKIATDMAIAAVVSKVIPAPAIPGITSGSNSAAAITAQIVTKAENGTISNVSTLTLAKMAAAQAADGIRNAPRDGIAGAISDVFNNAGSGENGSSDSGSCVDSPPVMP